MHVSQPKFFTNERRATIVVSLVALLITACGKENLVPLLTRALPPKQKTVTLLVRHYCATPNYRYKDAIASNYSAKVDKGIIVSDFDRDGIPNLYDVDSKLNIAFNFRDTNADGYSDLLMLLGGFTAEAQDNLKLCPAIYQDTDKDGLTDCEENNLLHTDPQKLDTDGDGIPDFLEVRSGMNPLDPYDGFQDLDLDGYVNSVEVKMNTPLAESPLPEAYDLAFHYEKKRTDLEDLACFDLEVKNVPVVNVSNGNLIVFFFIEEDKYGLPFILAYNVIVPRSQPDQSLVELEYSALTEGGALP